MLYAEKKLFLTLTRNFRYGGACWKPSFFPMQHGILVLVCALLFRVSLAGWDVALRNKAVTARRDRAPFGVPLKLLLLFWLRHAGWARYLPSLISTMVPVGGRG